MFRKLTDTVFASPQIGLGEVAEAKGMGVTLVINNRPEGESDDQTPGPEIEAAVRAAATGLDPVWVARVSRPPLGVCCEHLRFSSGHKPLTVADFETAERGPRAQWLQWAGVGHAPTLTDPAHIRVLVDFLLGPVA